MKLFVTMVDDRHADPVALVFTTAEAAVERARAEARANGAHPEDFDESHDIPEGWLYYATYSVEGDCVWVVETELDPEVTE